MQYRLRTLLILMTVGPLVVWLFIQGLIEGLPGAAWLAAIVLASEFLP